MMRAHDRGHGIREGHAIQDLRSYDRVHLHLLELFHSQLAGFVDDVLRHGEFANVMQQGRGAQGVDLIGRKADLLGDFHRVCSHALQMRMRGVVFGLDGQG